MKWIAKERGFFGNRIVEPGEKFDADEFKGKWAVKAREYKAEAEKPEEKLVEEAKEGLQGKRKKKKTAKKD